MPPWLIRHWHMPARDGASPIPRFARGFVLADGTLEPPVPGWLSERVHGLTLWRAPEVEVARTTCGDTFIALLGLFVDTEGWLPRDAALKAAATALARSESEFLDATDGWSGRYLVIYGDTTARQVMTDASGMRSAFYALDGPFVLASHARLVADIVQADAWPANPAFLELHRSGRQNLVLPRPGRTTPWAGVVMLPPNQVLDVEDRRLRRIFPRGPLPMLDPAGAAALVAPALRGQVLSLVATGRPVAMSLTGGLDSRVSLAASRPARHGIRYFTYRRQSRQATEWDVAQASEIAAELGLCYEVIHAPAAGLARELAEEIKRATILSHGRAIVAAYRRTFRSDTIHVRSNVSGVGSAFYRKAWLTDLPRDEKLVTPEMLARIWAHGRPTAQALVDAFADWMDAIGFHEVEHIDPFDVVYWEHRLASWHANMLLESDFAFDTHVLFNARTILRTLAAVQPVEERRRRSALRLVVANLWPELGRWPTEPRTLRKRLRGVRHLARRVSYGAAG